MATRPSASRVQSWLRPAIYLGHNPVTLIGAVLTTSAAVTLIGFWLRESVRETPTHPYAGILFFFVLPAVFVLGLLLMPLGVWWRRRRLRARGELPEQWPRIDLGAPVIRNAVVLVAIATVLNVAILGTASYRGVEYMGSNAFCGTSCHTVMQPQYTAFLDGPHSRVGCVQCHIGEGASWFVRSKLSGTRQVFAVALETYSRPIPSPVEHLRPARETCEQCHWPQKFHGDKFLVRTKYADDEANTASTTVLVVKIGGGASEGHVGIHGQHLDPARPISYVATGGKRQVIPVVETVDAAGQKQTYVSTEIKATSDDLARGERRTMDCMDCHNRPSHTFELPERALDRALAEGRISTALPFIKKKGIELLRAEYPDRETATRRIAADLAGFYQKSHPDAYRAHRGQVEAAAGELSAIYLRNVFPDMEVGWGTYPNNVGHEDFLGCFRCHDDNHKRADGKAIAQECTTCHTVLAMDESNPKVLSDLGLR
jgi:nitrate/TMAO reductase-like tetraheme cytochrome c subunit